MNVRTLIIRFGIGTLVALSAAVSADEPIIDLAAAEIININTNSDKVSAAITARHGQFTPVGPVQSSLEAERARTELQLADDMARKIQSQLERRLASQLDRVI